MWVVLFYFFIYEQADVSAHSAFHRAWKSHVDINLRSQVLLNENIKNYELELCTELHFSFFFQKFSFAQHFAIMETLNWNDDIM